MNVAVMLGVGGASAVVTVAVLMLLQSRRRYGWGLVLLALFLVGLVALAFWAPRYREATMSGYLCGLALAGAITWVMRSRRAPGPPR